MFVARVPNRRMSGIEEAEAEVGSASLSLKPTATPNLFEDKVGLSPNSKLNPLYKSVCHQTATHELNSSTLTEGSGKPPTKSCICGNKMSGADSHSVCICCLGLEHAKAALATPATCEHCARFTHKTRKRRLNKQAKLFAGDPVLGVTDPPLPEPAGGSRGLAAPLGIGGGPHRNFPAAGINPTRPSGS